MKWDTKKKYFRERGKDGSYWKYIGETEDRNLVFTYREYPSDLIYPSIYRPEVAAKIFVELPQEKWVNLWWKDKHHTDVIAESMIFNNEKDAINAALWSTENYLHIKTVRVE